MLPPVPWVPALPVLVRKDLRQMLTVLDPYLALILSAAGTIYRFVAAAPDPAARPVFAILVGLALAVLVLPLAAGTGLTFGVTVLAIGHWPSVGGRLPLKQWRFAGGGVFWGCAQVVTGTARAMAEHAYGYVFLLAACAGLGVSLSARNRIMAAR